MQHRVILLTFYFTTDCRGHPRAVVPLFGGLFLSVRRGRLLRAVRVLALLAVLSSVGCGVSQGDKGVPAAGQSLSAANAAATNWGRMRQCAEQADRLAVRLKWSAQKDAGWGSHYNSERQRCFVVETTFNPDKDLEKITVFEELYDGFEGVVLGDRLIKSVDSKDLLCHVTAHPLTEPLGRIDCAEYRKFLLDRMEK